MTDTKIQTKLISTEKSLAIVETTIPLKIVEDHRKESVEHMAGDVTIKGFRKGKAPLSIVEKQLDPQKIVEHTLNHLVPQIISDTIKEHKLKAIGNPHLKIKSVKPDEDWTFEIQFPLQPEFELGKYQEEIKKVNATNKIWTPDQGEEPKPEDKEALQLNKILDKLLETIKFDVPAILVEEEVNQSLSRLIDQTEKLGLKMEDYLKNLGKTPEQLKEEYEKAATDNLRLEFILEAIAQELKNEIPDKEVDQFIQASGTQEAKDRLDNPKQRQYIKAILRKRKTIDALLRL